MNILFVHGYSESSLGAYFSLPERVKTLIPGVNNIALAAFNSLDDIVTIDDLAFAMETRVSKMEASSPIPWQIGETAIICHSTGALVARRWLLNRLKNGGGLPSHLITMAGANHGSTLAQMGKSTLGYLQKLLLKHIVSVGANVLTDLDYGSEFLVSLNREWLEYENAGKLATVWTFSMGGDFVGTDPSLQIFWQTHEEGSDNTVRISGANLNYSMIAVASGNGETPILTVTRPKRVVPHLVLGGYSHFGDASGIIGFIDPGGDRVLQAVSDALAVTSIQDYQTVQERWLLQTDAWMTAARAGRHRDPTIPSAINATGVFLLQDESARAIGDCMIAIMNKDQLGAIGNPLATEAASIAARAAATNATSNSILPHSPIQNNVACGSYSFYFDYDAFVAGGSHVFQIDAALPEPLVPTLAGSTPLISYIPITFDQQQLGFPALMANEFTYVALTLRRSNADAYVTYAFNPGMDLNSYRWPPFGLDDQLPS